MTDTMIFDTPQDDELRAIYLEEAREQVDILDQGLVRLEHEPENSELIQGIFRAAHTLKGSSAAMGFDHVAALTHAMEDVLSRIRDGKLPVLAETADALLEALDQLRELMVSVERQNSDTATSGKFQPIIDELHGIATGAAHAAARAAHTEQYGLDPLPNEQVALLVQFDADCQMPAIRAFMLLRALEPLGAVVHLQPSQQEIDEGRIGSRMLMVCQSEMPESAFHAAVDSVSEVQWMRFARGKAAAGMGLNMPSREEGEANIAARGVNAPKSTSDLQLNQQTVRVGVDTLDRIMNLVGELVLDRTQVARLKDALGEIHPEDDELIRDIDAVSNHLGTIVGELHEQVLMVRMLPVSQLFNRFPRMVRDLCRTLHKDVNLVMMGESEQLDRAVIEKLVDPLTHILRNAIDHGMETPAARAAQGKAARGTVMLSARREEGYIQISVSDDGPGLDAERLKEKAVKHNLITQEQARSLSQQEAYGLIFASGLSTAQTVSDVSGRGVGMDVVKRNVESLGGSVVVSSEAGAGTTMTLKIPLTLAIMRALIVRVGEVPMAVPITVVEETIKIRRAELHAVRGRALMQWRGMVVPVIQLCEALPGCGDSHAEEHLQVVVVRYGAQVACFVVDAIVGHQEIVVKTLGTYLGEIAGLAGATILGNGRVALIVDIGKLFESGLLTHAAAEGLGWSREEERRVLAGTVA